MKGPAKSSGVVAGNYVEIETTCHAGSQIGSSFSPSLRLTRLVLHTMAPCRNHPRPGLPAEALFACLVDPDVASVHQSAAAIELASRLLGGLIGIDYAAHTEDGPEALMAALERPETMPEEHSVAGGLSVPQAILMALAGHSSVPVPPPDVYAAVIACPLCILHWLAPWHRLPCGKTFASVFSAAYLFCIR